jgi:hypothetical protein
MASLEDIKAKAKQIAQLAQELATDAETVDGSLPTGVQEAISVGATGLGIAVKILDDIP